jgi:hypothetical protein
MKKYGILIFLTLLFAGFSTDQVFSQSFLKKVKNKTEDKAIEKIFGKDKTDQQNQGNPSNYPNQGTSGSSGSSSGSSSGANNNRGGGLSNTAPDVKANIKDAGTAFDGKQYSNARFSVRQAILGIELEIGKQILKGLPESISGLDKVTEEDNVTSSGIGFVGLIIERTYRKGDQELGITIGNDAGMLSMANMYLASGSYASTQDQNHKQVKFKEYRAVLEYDESSGYKLSVPFGQSSILIAEGINFASEEEIMSAAENIDIEKIKKELGEQ